MNKQQGCAPTFTFHTPAKGHRRCWATPNLAGWIAWYCMCRGYLARLPFSVTSDQCPGHVVHYDGNGALPYTSHPPDRLTYGGMSRY